MERYIRTTTAGIANAVGLIPNPDPYGLSKTSGLVTTTIGAAFGRVCSAFTYDKDREDAFGLLLILIRVTIDATGWSVPDAMERVEAGRLRAHAKHGENSIESKQGDDIQFWLACLGEEFGESCEAQSFEEFQAEALDIVTVATAWASALG